MEVVVVYRGRVRAPREARVVFWEGVRSGLGIVEAAGAAGVTQVVGYKSVSYTHLTLPTILLV